MLHKNYYKDISQNISSSLLFAILSSPWTSRFGSATNQFVRSQSRKYLVKKPELLQHTETCRLLQRLATSLSVREVVGSIRKPVKPDTVSPATRHGCDVSSELCCLGARLRLIPSVTRDTLQHNTSSIMKIHTDEEATRRRLGISLMQLITLNKLHTSICSWPNLYDYVLQIYGDFEN